MAFWPSHRCKRFPELDKNARRPIFVVFELPAQQVVPHAAVTTLFLVLYGIDALNCIRIFFHDDLALQFQCWCKFTSIDGPFCIEQFKFLDLFNRVEMLVVFFNDCFIVLDHFFQKAFLWHQRPWFRQRAMT